MPEQCGICGEAVPLADAAHVMRNPPDAEGVADDYVCQPCYREHVAALFDEEGEEAAGDAVEEDVARDRDEGGDAAPGSPNGGDAGGDEEDRDRE